VEFNLLPESSVCAPQVYGYMATYLTEEYTIETGAHKGCKLSADTAVGALRSMINMAKARFGVNGSPEAKLFLTCLDKNSSTPSAAWLKGLETKMIRTMYQREMEAGNSMDISAAAV